MPPVIGLFSGIWTMLVAAGEAVGLSGAIANAVAKSFTVASSAPSHFANLPDLGNDATLLVLDDAAAATTHLRGAEEQHTSKCTAFFRVAIR